MMNFEMLYANVAYIAAFSVAAERLVEIVKGFLGTRLTADPVTDSGSQAAENKRIAWISFISILAGIVTALAAWWAGAMADKGWPEVLLLGFLASGGSGLWNSVLAYLLQVKNLNKALVNNTRKLTQLGQPAR